MKLFSKKQQTDLPSRRTGRREGEQARATPEDLDKRYSFRRNRTLTGSLSSGVASANERNSELKSARIQHHDLKHHRKHLFLSFLGVVLVASSIFFALYQSIVLVRIEGSEGLPLVDSKHYENKVQQYLNTRPLERFRFSLNTKELAKYLQSNGFPEVAEVRPDSRISGFVQSTLTLQLREPTVVWRTDSGEPLYVDGSGNAFSRNYYAEPTVSVIDNTGIKTSDGKVLASNRFLGFIGQVVGEMHRSNYTVTEVLLPEGTTRQVDIKVSEASYPIKFTIDRPAGEQAEDASRALRFLSIQGVNPEYLDVRVSGRAYYR